MEKITDTPITEVFENDIDKYLHLFMDEQGIEDMKSVSQNVFHACLMYIRKMVFPDKKVLKLNGRLEGYINNNNTGKSSNLNNSNCNAYDIDLLNAICDYYIYICNLYDKAISMVGFSKLTGIDNDTISQWSTRDNNINRLSTSGSIIYEKLTKEREASLVGKLESNKNPIAQTVILNKHFGYNMPGVSEHRKKEVLTASELPTLGTELHQIPAQITQNDP